MFALAQEALDRLRLILASVDRVSVSEMHSTLGLTKAIRTQVDLIETTLAAEVAANGRHGDGGIEVLRQASGLTRSEAVRRVKTAKELESLPAAREAVASGRLSLRNAHVLVDAARKTAARSVDADDALLQNAQEMPADEFARHSKAWVARRQDPSDLETQHRRNCKNRHLRFWNDRDGAINMRGSFDAEMGTRIRGHIQHFSEALRLNDRRGLRKNRKHPQRSEAQRNADALDRILNASIHNANTLKSQRRAVAQTDSTQANPRSPNASRTSTSNGAPSDDAHKVRSGGTGVSDPLSGRGVSHSDAAVVDTSGSDVNYTSLSRGITQSDTDEAGAADPDNVSGARKRGVASRNSSAAGCAGSDVADVSTGLELSLSDAAEVNAAGSYGHSGHRSGTSVAPSGSGHCASTAVGDASEVDHQVGVMHSGKGGNIKTGAEIIVRADLAALTGQPGGLAELVGAGPIPQSVLERFTCNASISAILFAGELKPLYEARTQRSPSVAQRRALIVRDGACVGCGADPSDCEAHHIVPWRQCKRTQIDNLVLVCWGCHDRIHKHNWQVTRNDNRYKLRPPTRTRPQRSATRHPASSHRLNSTRDTPPLPTRDRHAVEVELINSPDAKRSAEQPYVPQVPRSVEGAFQVGIARHLRRPTNG